MSRVGQGWLCTHGSFLASEMPSWVPASPTVQVLSKDHVFTIGVVSWKVLEPTLLLANGTSAFLGFLFLGSLRPTGAESWECV